MEKIAALASSFGLLVRVFLLVFAVVLLLVLSVFFTPFLLAFEIYCITVSIFVSSIFVGPNEAKNIYSKNFASLWKARLFRDFLYILKDNISGNTESYRELYFKHSNRACFNVSAYTDESKQGIGGGFFRRSIIFNIVVVILTTVSFIALYYFDAEIFKKEFAIFYGVAVAVLPLWYFILFRDRES